MPKIGLCMIVKNEQHVIERCLDSVKSMISFVLVEDTGSEDNTVEVIRAWLVRNEIPGLVYFNEWKNFAHNRSSALARLREQADIDFAFIMDADDVLVIDSPDVFNADLSSLGLDAYRIKLFGGGSEYFRTQMVSNRLEFKYKGVLHEFIDGPAKHTSSTLSGCFIQSNREGARSKDPKKYEKDAAVLEQALETETDQFMISRYTFYLAQSLRDSGQAAEAVKFYRQRAKLGFWVEERYVALLYAGRMMENLPEYSSNEVISVYNEAIDLLPSRVEAFYSLARYFRLRNQHSQAVEIALRGYSLTIPAQGLFIELAQYKFGIKDELAVAAYWADRKELCLQICSELIEQGACLPNQLDRIIKNGDFAVSALQKQIERFAAAKGLKVVPSMTPGNPDDYAELVRKARLLEANQGCDVKQVVSLYEQAIRMSPAHAEAKHGLVRFCRQRNLLKECADIIAGVCMVVPDQSHNQDDSWILDYGLAYELCLACVSLGLNEKCISFGMSALQANDFPGELRDELLEAIRKADITIRDTLLSCDRMRRNLISSHG